MFKLIFLAFLLTAPLGCSGDPADKYIHEGFVNFQEQKYDEAIASYEKAVRLNPKAAGAYNMIGMAYRFKYNKSGVPEFRQKEMEAFQKAIEIDPQNWVGMINLATDYYDEGQKAKAAALYKKALELNPNHPEKPVIQRMIKEGEQP